jgi:hypothetical protein
MQSYPIRLLPFPCGCVVDMEDADDLTVEVDGVEFIECPWCDDVFSCSDVGEFVEENRPPVIQPQRQLCTDGRRLLEVVGLHGDGTRFIVRERRRGARPEHSRGAMRFLLD